jgi:hypothetical protein
MSPGNLIRLLRLVDRDFRELPDDQARTPTPPKFKTVKLNPARFDKT